MPATIDQPATAPAAPDTDIPQGRPSTGAAPSNFRPPNPAFEGVAKRLGERLAKKAVPSSAAAAKTPSFSLKPPATSTPAPSPEPTESPSEPAATPESQMAADESELTVPSAAKTPEESTTPEAPKAEEGEKTEAPAADAKPKKVSPWRLVDQYKQSNSELKTKLETAERELITLKSSKPTEVPKEVTERLQAAEAKVKEYEEHLRFADYQRHPEFIEKYQKPYEAAWKRATAELSEVTVTDPATGATRSATAEDMLALINLPLGKAREYADQLFGAFSNDAMEHRKAIKTLFESQADALKEAKESGVARQKAMQEQTQAQHAAISKQLTETWETANREAVTDTKYGKFFAPVEGDQEGNSALAKGFELADRAFAEDPRDPTISESERAARVKRHAAMRNRAAAFGRMRKWIEQRDTRIAELEKMLDEFQASEPSQAASTTKPAAPSQAADPYASFAERLRKKAR